MSQTDMYMRFAAEAIAKQQPGPAHRHLQRSWDASSDEGGMTDDQIDRWADLSDALDKLEKAAGMKWGRPVDSQVRATRG